MGNVPSPSGSDEPFYGTSRSFRVKPTTSAPTEGPLSRVQRPTADNDIIPDTVLTGRFQPPAAPPPAPAGTSGVRRSVLSPLPMPSVTTPQGNHGNDTGGRDGHLQPSGFYPTTTPVGSAETLHRHGDFTPMGSPMVGYRDPVTGALKRRPSGLFPPEIPTHKSHSPATQKKGSETPRPGTTSRFRRSVGADQAPSQQPHLNPIPRTAVGTTSTSRIRRGLGPTESADSTAPELPTCAVACAHCQGHFTVVIKSEAYTVLCVHCGQLNRIDPL